MRTPISLALLVLLALVPPLAVGQETFNLRRTAPEGSEFSYKMQMDINAGGQELVFRATNVMKVAKVEPNGDYTIEAQLKNATIDMGGGSEQEVPASVSSTKNNGKGEIIEVKNDGVEPDADGYRFPNIMSWSFDKEAYQIGDTITIQRAASKTTGNKKSETTIKLLAVEEVAGKRAVKVEFDSKETEGDTPTSITGTGWIDPTTGMMVKLEANFKNLVITGAPMPFDGKVSYTQI